MDGNTLQAIAEIKEAIKSGTLTKDIIERRLQATIHHELGKKNSPADMELIEACQNLLWELHTGNPYVSYQKQSLARHMQKDLKTKRLWRIPKYTTGIAVVSVLLIVGGVFLDAALKREWLDGNSTQDELQYIIRGQTIDPGIVNEGKADDSMTDPQSITTTNLDEAIKVLGFVPAMPQWLPEGWELLSYDVFKTEPSNWFTVTYSNTKQAYALIYHIVYYSDIEQALAVFEQSRAGEEYILANGKTVYISKNLDDTTCVWYEDLACYNLIGPEDVNTFLEIIQSIKESP